MSSLERAAFECRSPKPYAHAPRFAAVAGVTDENTPKQLHGAGGGRAGGSLFSREPSDVKRGAFFTPAQLEQRATACKPRAAPPGGKLSGGAAVPQGERPVGVVGLAPSTPTPGSRFGWRRASFISRADSPLLLR